jgi:hypothetical protein
MDYVFGIGGRKAARLFMPADRGYLQVQVPLLQGAWFGTRSATSSCFVLLGILLRGQQWIPSMEALIVTNRLQPSSMRCNLTGIACYEQGRIES